MTASLTAIADGSATLESESAGRLRWHPALVAVPAALALVAGALTLDGGGSGDRASDVVRALLVIAWCFAGSVLAMRRPLCRLGILLLGGTLLGATTFAAAEAVEAGWTGTGGDLAEVAHDVGSLALCAVGLHLLLALPRGDLARARRPLVIGAYVVAVVTGLVYAIGSGSEPTVLPWIGWIVAVALGLPGAHATYLRTAGIERQRLQWVGCGAAVAGEIALVAVALDLLVDWPAAPGLVAGAATVLIPVALVIGASPKLVSGVDRVLVHTVSLAGLTATTFAVYLVIVLGLGQVPTDDERQLLGLSMLAAAVAAALYLPARQRLQDAANRIVYGERYAPDEVLRTFGTRLTRSIPMDELLLQLAESLKKTLGLTRAEVWTGTPELLERAVSVPYADPIKLPIGDRERPVVARAGVSGAAWATVWLPALLEGRTSTQLRVAPATHSGELLGLIVVERPADGDTFTEGDDTMLAELARQCGLALHNVQLDSALQATLDEVQLANEQLRASRARIVATADAERRKIERNLHDGAQQHLVALAVNLRLVQDILTEDTETATEMIEQLAADVKETIAELRALAHGIFPPLLVDAGLGDALRAAGNRSPLDVTVEVEATGRYGGEVEAAVYFCCLEALQNAAKHAPGSSVSVRVWEEAGGLLFEVADDGPGFDVAGATKGHGYTNMADRLGAIGGTVRWTSAPGEGSQVRGSLPLVAT